jgi:spoIIIJ-associated protein
MEWVEIAARTVEEARERALDTLGVDEQDAEIELLEEPRTGLFGKLRGQARVRARVRPAQVRPKVERRDRRRRKDEGTSGRRSEKDDASQTDAVQPAGAGGGAHVAVDEDDDDAERDDAEAGAGTDQSRGTGRRRRGRRGTGSGRSAERTPGTARAEGGAEMPELTIDEQADVVAGFLRGLADQFGAAATETAIERVDDETVEIRLTGPELGLLIGPKGQTLHLIQELARTAVQRRGGGTQDGRIRIDIAGYRQRRSEALARFTEQVAADVVASGQAKALEPMNPADRKVVHDTANGIEGVRTVSEGEEPRRRVVLVPADD